MSSGEIRRRLPLTSTQLPDKMALLFYEMGQMIEHTRHAAEALDDMTLNPNQQKLFDILETSRVPPKKWIHMLLYGGVGGGKTYGILIYILKQMLLFSGMRVLIVRQTIQELRNSIFLDAKELLGKKNVPFESNNTLLTIKLENGSEIWCCSDKALTSASEDKSKGLGGTQFTIAVVEEADSISEELAKTIPGRMRQNVGNCRKVIFYDCNPPNKQHWTYKWWFDPDAELSCDDPESRFRVCCMPSEGNVEHVGEEYIEAMTEDYARDPVFYRRMRMGQFGPSTKGTPIYGSEFSDTRHISDKPLVWNRSLPMLRGWDFGHTGTGLVVMQDDYKVRRIKVFRSIIKQQCILDVFCDEILPQLRKEFPGATWVDYVDPNGSHKTTLDQRSCLDILRDHGLKPKYTWHSSVAYGINVIMKQLRLSINKESALVFDPQCEALIEALAGGYANKKGRADKEIDPVKDGYYDHIADAFRYVMIHIREYKDTLSKDAEPTRSEWVDINSGREVGPKVIRPGQRIIVPGPRRGNTSRGRSTLSRSRIR